MLDTRANSDPARFAANPDADAMRRALYLLREGRFAEAWPLYERRLALHGAPQLGIRPWTGEPVERLLVWGEQGYGDQIQFARFAISLAEQGVDVTFLCLPGLERLLSSAGLRAVARSGRVDVPDSEAWVMSNSLPYRLGLDLSDIEGAPYLSAKPRSVGGRIGIATRGNPHHHNDANRSLPEAAAARLFGIPGAISLAPEVTGASDFQDTAEIIAGLDLVISVDTAIAHLSGALGKSTYVLLPSMLTDWRWLEVRPDSPWYGSLRLFRQATPGDWDSVVSEAIAAV